MLKSRSTTIGKSSNSYRDDDDDSTCSNSVLVGLRYDVMNDSFFSQDNHSHGGTILSNSNKLDKYEMAMA